MFNNKKIHFIGIGGISMSAIAELMKSKNCSVTGSDISESKTVTQLREQGIDVFIGENPNLIDNADIVVWTAAISDDNPELVRAKELGKELYERSEFLGKVSQEYENVICISGTHGKSTTTGMISTCFLKANLNPTIQIGAFLPIINSNSYIGDNKYFIMESCEYVDSFLKFHPTSAIILNIDDDHLDYFGTIDKVKESFSAFAHLLPTNGSLVINNDDANTVSIDKPNVKTITYGIDNKASIMAKDIVFDDLGYPEFNVYQDDNLLFNIKLSVLGKHNIYNALATISMCIIHNLNKDDIKSGLESYHGVERRFELVGKYKDSILVYDDYAHHPTEILSTLSSSKKIKCNKCYAVFQSHTYSRTIEHLKEFAEVLKEFDNVIIAPIYPAREKNIWNVKETDLVDLIKPYNSNVCYIDSFDKIADYLKSVLKDGDMVITIGAGPVNEVGLKLLGKEKK